MRSGPLHTFAYETVRWVQWGVFGLLIFVMAQGILPRTDSVKLEEMRAWLRDRNDVFGTILAVAWGVLQWTKETIGEPRLWKVVHGVLMQFQRLVFDDVDETDLADDHRITLYKRCRWCFWPSRGRSRWWPWGAGAWPWSGWLIPVVRAGPRSVGRTTFLAKNDKEFDGVCGAAYFVQAGTMSLPPDALPNITRASTEAEIAEYAQKTFVSPEMVKDRIKGNRPCARYFLAHALELEYRKWGVVMIDSRAAEIPKPLIVQHRFEQIKEALQHLLGK